VLLTAACNRPARLLDANANNLRTARTVAAAFHEQYGAETGLPDVPFVTLGMEGGQGYSYDISHNVLFVTPYSQADFDTQKIFAKAAMDDRAGAVYDDVMFRFFTAHQLMHLYYDRQPLAGVSSYREELRVNAMTWLFLEDAGLLGPAHNEVVTTLGELEQRLVRRFPILERRDVSVSDLKVDDNTSYWYVTSVSMLAAREDANSIASVASLVEQFSQESRFSAEAGE